MALGFSLVLPLVLYSAGVVGGTFTAMISHLQGGGVHGRFPRLQLLQEPQAPRKPLDEPLELDRTEGKERGRMAWVYFAPLVISISYIFGDVFSVGIAKGKYFCSDGIRN